MNLERLIGFVDARFFQHTQRHLRDVDVFVLKGSLEGKTYEIIAQEYGYTCLYLQQDIGHHLWRALSKAFQEPVSKKSCRAVIERHYLQFVAQTPNAPPPQQFSPSPVLTDMVPALAQHPLVDGLGTMIDVSVFYGRQEELTTLHQWTVTDGCRLVTLLGMGGIGKTSLAVKAAAAFQGDFEFVVWRSLRNAAPVEDTLTEWTQILANPEETGQLDTLENRITALISLLKRHRCLLILDNFESVLEGGTQAGAYNLDHAGYGMLLRYIAQVQHRSCLIVTSREQPRGIATLVGPTMPVRSLQLKGLGLAETCRIFTDKGCQPPQDNQLQTLHEHYGGNPLALKIVAAALLELGNGDANELVPYLDRGIFVFDDINNLLARHFNRLSPAEMTVMYWLAINREPVSLAQLEADTLPGTLIQDLFTAVQSLCRRSLIERKGSLWFLQPVVLEYVSQRFVSGFCDELFSGEWSTIIRLYAIVKAQSLDYIREAQRRFIVLPILSRLQAELGSSQTVWEHLRSQLYEYKCQHPGQVGYVAGNLLNLMRELQPDLSGVDCSHLTIWQADFRQVSLHQSDLSHSDLSRSVFTPVLSATLSVAFSPDGQYFALGNADNRLRLWQVAECKERWIGEGHQSWVSAVAFSPDGSLLASGSFDHTIRLWNVQTGQCIGELTGHRGWIWSLEFSPEGETLVSGCDDCTVKIWSIARRTCQRTLEAGQGWVWSVDYSPTGHLIASAGNDCTIRLWEAASGNCIRIFQGHTGWVRSAVFNDTGDQLFSGSNDGTVRIWDVETGNCLKVLQGHRQVVKSVAYGSALSSVYLDALKTGIEGEIIVSGSQDCTIRIWDAQTGRCLSVLRGSADRIWSVALHPSGQMLLSGSNDSTIRLWNPRTGQPLRTLQTICVGIKEVAYSPNGQWLASGGDDKLIRIWNLQTGQRHCILEGHNGWIWDLAFSPKSNQLASASGDGTLHLWDIASGTCLQTFVGHLNLVFAVAFDPQGRWLASGSNDQSAKLWEVATGVCLRTWQHQEQIWSIAFHPQAQYLATSGDRRGIPIWPLEADEALTWLPNAGAMVHSVTFSSDGQWLAMGRDDHIAEVWDWQAGVCYRQFDHGSRVWSVAFSADGKYLATGGFDHTVKLWLLETGHCIHELHKHQGEVWSVAFHPHHLHVASGAQDGQVLVWDAIAGVVTQTLREVRLYEALQVIEATGLSEAQKQSLQMLGATV
ncbi:MAG TPA: NB-ARC domain-containing protein [Stenomitos sp.]